VGLVTAVRVERLRSGPGELQIQRVASPRNHHNLQREVARFWRPLPILGCPQHRCQIPFQLDLEFSLAWDQEDAVDEATTASDASMRVAGWVKA
jgi:hypothetical protein